MGVPEPKLKASMGSLCQWRNGCGRRVICAVVVVGFGLAGVDAAALGVDGQAEAHWVGNGHTRTERLGTESMTADPWESALRARTDFEAEPQGTHTKAEYARVMDGFRVIYHADPSDAHAARAVMQVAELLADEGRELNDRRSLRNAAGQYEFLAKAYPGGNLAAAALGQALDLLGPQAADDAAEASRVRVELEEDYPKSAAARAAHENSSAENLVADGAAPRSRETYTAAGRDGSSSERMRSPMSQAPIIRAEIGAAPQTVVRTTPTSQKRGVGQPDSSLDVEGPDRNGDRAEPAAAASAVATVAEEKPPSGPAAVVTGIRHWSTASYTRVAIDLSVGSEDGVKYQAARVENPDRIYFDLHHAKLAPQLVGKSFNVTDDGFLTKIRAAQFSDDVTRVVLDVHEVAEYSAFLLPNPYRLIIDIHGRQGMESKGQGIASVETSRAPSFTPTDNKGPRTGAGLSAGGTEDAAAATPALASDSKTVADAAAESSSLPPMPVTDGSAAFGLAPRSGAAMHTPGGQAQAVAWPRVVVSSKPTAAKPVPNTVTTRSTETGAQFGTEMAAVSEQPGRVEATSHPTSQPIVSKNSEQPTANRTQPNSSAHYEPRTRHANTRATAAVYAGETPSVQHGRGAFDTAQGRLGHAGAAVADTDSTPEAAPPTADGETSMMRALGLKIGRIVIDAGHGGHDSGTLGAGGIEEKDVVLDVALRLGKLLHDRLGAEIVYTRADDTFIPLETRTAIANKAQADLFVSVHANSSSDESARGVEVYYLNFTSDPDAMRVAARENAVSTQSVHELSDLVKKIALKDKIEESHELASDVDASLFAGLTKGNPGLKNRGVKKAPFVVLIGANMPSILAEISFVTNPEDADELERPAYRERVAESLYAGVARYAAGINGGGPRVRTTEQAAR
jgi:N-acetylmuramoyl-L-alanine amidase